MIRGTVGRGAVPSASRTGRMQRGACLGLFGVLAVGGPLLAQPPGTEGLREDIEIQFRVTATGGGIGLLPLDEDRGVALIELRGDAVYVDGAGPLTVQGLTDALGATAAPLLRLRRLDGDRQRAVLGLTAAARAVAPAAAEEEAVAAEPPADDAVAAEEAELPAVEAGPAFGAPPVAPPAPPAIPGADRRRRTVRGDVVRFGGEVHVPADERLDGDVVLIGGRLRVDGEVTRDVVLIGGSAHFGPEAVVRRDVTVVAGRVTRHPDARFERELNEVGFGSLDLDLGGLGREFRWPRPAPFDRSSDLVQTLLRFAFLGLLGSVVLLVAAGSASRVADRVIREPVKAGAVGFLAQLLFFPLLVVGSVTLIITLVGIPLLALVPVVLVAALVVLILGFTGVVQLVSRLLARGQRSDLVLFWVGLVLLMTPALFGDALDIVGGPFRLFALILGVTGFVVEYLAWTAGSGAVLLNWFDGAPAAAGPPPPIPGPAGPPAPAAPLPPAAEPD